MNNINDLAKKIQLMRCPKHNEKPKSVKVINKEIKVETCCNEFRTKVMSEIDKHINGSFI